MINATAEIIKDNKSEMVDLKDIDRQAGLEVSNLQREGAEAEEIARSLELKLMEAQAARERKEEAERKGKETKEKITELTG